ncbi:DUF1207 domain-containing protein [Planctomicrobium sp. SH668]|uniref:DUF1207 domain-containing protein n=1 Tax=Planctomicrobium sp. SH668 TaxID=3448126 RepID=UPI003F5B743A
MRPKSQLLHLSLLALVILTTGPIAIASDWIDSNFEIPSSGIVLASAESPIDFTDSNYATIQQSNFDALEMPSEEPVITWEELPQASNGHTTTYFDNVSTYAWQVMPQGLLYHSYLAGTREPRTQATWLWDRDRGLVWEAAVGGRFGVLRHGTFGPDGEGFQLDVEGAALVRIDPEQESDLEAADFRAGFVGTWKKGQWRWKAGYSHVSSHVGDEYLIRNPTFVRDNYVRDSLLVGVTYDFNPKLQGYGEFAYAVGAGGLAEPVELQFGVQYAPALFVDTGLRGAPFAAIHGHLRQEFNFSGSVNAEAGWAWRGGQTNHLFRLGVQHYNGHSMQWSFGNRYESMTGMGIWFDF